MGGLLLGRRTYIAVVACMEYDVRSCLWHTVSEQQSGFLGARTAVGSPHLFQFYQVSPIVLSVSTTGL